MLIQENSFFKKQLCDILRSPKVIGPKICSGNELWIKTTKMLPFYQMNVIKQCVTYILLCLYGMRFMYNYNQQVLYEQQQFYELVIISLQNFIVR